MSSSVTLDHPVSYSVPPPTAIVQQIPSIPDYGWLKIAQREKTQVYTVNDVTGYSLLSIKVGSSITNTDYSNIEQHISDYLGNSYFVDGSIAQLISDNIDDLF